MLQRYFIFRLALRQAYSCLIYVTTHKTSTSLPGRLYQLVAALYFLNPLRPNTSNLNSF